MTGGSSGAGGRCGAAAAARALAAPLAAAVAAGPGPTSRLCCHAVKTSPMVMLKNSRKPTTSSRMRTTAAPRVPRRYTSGAQTTVPITPPPSPGGATAPAPPIASWKRPSRDRVRVTMPSAEMRRSTGMFRIHSIRANSSRRAGAKNIPQPRRVWRKSCHAVTPAAASGVTTARSEMKARTTKTSAPTSRMRRPLILIPWFAARRARFWRRERVFAFAIRLRPPARWAGSSVADGSARTGIGSARRGSWP